jgi:hypothetical protein
MAWSWSHKVLRETLRGGDLRLMGSKGVFVFHRLRPGAILSYFEGRDTGEFGKAPLEYIETEHVTFDKPVEWFFDATKADNAARSVSDEYTAWLRRSKDVLSRLHVLAATQEIRLMIDISRHFSDAGNRLALYSDAGEWRTAINKTAPRVSAIPDLGARTTEEAVPIEREGDLTIKAPGSEWSFTNLPNRVVLSKFKGFDSGDLTDHALAAMRERIGAGSEKTRWFLDLREAQTVASHVSQTWTEFIAARQNGFARIVAVASSPLFPLVLTVANYRSGTDHLLRVHREYEPFRAELAAAVGPASVGAGL